MSKLQQLRQAAGLSQSQFAKAAGINVGTLRHYEQGSRKIDHAELGTLLKICAILKCRIEDIIEDPEIVERLRRHNMETK